MAKDKISDYSSTANSNTDIAGINIDEGCAPSGINDAIRTLMAQLKTWQSGGQDVYIHPAGSASAPSITANGDTNTGIFFPAADTIAFAEGGAEIARFDSSGNLGLGVTPSTYSIGKVVEVGFAGNSFWGYAANTNLVTQNVNLASGALRYSSTNPASFYQQSSGVHTWGVAPSGTAGNAITFTQAMTLDSGGRLLVGSSSSIGSCNAQFNDAGGQAALFNSSSASGSYVGWYNSGSARGFIGAAAQLIGGGSASNFAVRAEGDLLFATSSFERARIDSSGNFLVGTTSSAANVNGNAAIIRNGTGGSTSFCTSSTSATLVDFQVQGGIKGSISSTTSTTTYATSSDYRLKENIVPMTDALSVVAQLKPCKYTWKVDGSDGQGFIAHELQAVVPDCVTGEKDAVNEDGSIKPQGIDTSFLVATLTAAIQELKAEFDAYKASHP
jgi:hypothetical protein